MNASELYEYVKSRLDEDGCEEVRQLFELAQVGELVEAMPPNTELTMRLSARFDGPPVQSFIVTRWDGMSCMVKRPTALQALSVALKPEKAA